MTPARANTHPYDRLTPDVVFAAVEQVGLIPDGRLLALNSYENRVYQVGIDADTPVVVKFYRPGRHTDEAVLEEHEFAWELVAADVPVVPPQRSGGGTLHRIEDFRYAVFDRRGGRWPELGSEAEREWMGRFIGRIHAVGRARRFRYRPSLSIERLGEASRQFLLEDEWLPDDLIDAYESVSEHVLYEVRAAFERVGEIATVRLHGDCHPGNVLWTDAGPHFVDLDDCMQGPAIQDLWMLLSGTRGEMSEQLGHLVRGYGQFADFDYAQIGLIEALRTLRMMHYAAWLARRWDDPAFPRAFPWFGEPRYWERHVLDLREQLAALQEEPLSID